MAVRASASVVLNDEQEKARTSESKYELIYGAAGSGKTLILLMRAGRLAQQAAGTGIAARVFTYGRTLANNGSEQVRLNGHGARVKVQTFHSWAAQTLHALGVSL